MIGMNNYREIGEAIKNSDTIAIASHINPDGDNLGSSLALYLGLKKINPRVKILKVDTIADNYLFLPAIDLIEEVEADYHVDSFIALDSADLGRLGRNMVIAKNANRLINIDHHISNDKYGDLNLVEADSSSTGELVYNLLVAMDIEIDRDIATCIYTAISSDTGSFKYSNTTSRTHRIVADLYNHNIDAGDINIELYQNKSMEKTKLFNLAMLELETYFDKQVGLVVVTKEMLAEAGAKMEDTEGLVETVRDIKSIELAIFIKEKDDCVKVSTRSKRFVDVSSLCSNFDGGGHKRAAGCTIYAGVEEAKKQILEKVELLI